MYHPDMGSLERFAGEAPYESPALIPGVDFDPWDADEVEIVGEATARHSADRTRHLEEENARLRGIVAELTEEKT